MSARAALALAAAVLFALPAAARTDEEDEPPILIEPQGTQFLFPDPDDPSRFVWVFLDGVEVTQGQSRLRGDSMIAVLARPGDDDEDEGTAAPAGGIGLAGESVLELYLEGAVELYEGDRRILRADAFFEDRVAGVSRVMHGELYVEAAAYPEVPIVVRYERMRLLPDSTVEASGVSVTNCDYAEPHWHIRTPWLRIDPTPAGRILSTGSETARVGDVPVLWWPGVSLNLDRERDLLVRDIDLGSSSRFGTELLAVIGGDASDEVGGLLRRFGYGGAVAAEWEGRVGLFSRRGLFTELVLSYETDESEGRILGAYINDKADTDERDVPITDSTRGRFDVEHRTLLDEDTVVDVELSYYSDRNFLREYYENEFRQDKPQESYVSYRNYDDDEVLNVLARFRMNDFETQVEYLPQVERRIAGRKLDCELFGRDVFISSRDFVSHARLAPDDETDTPSERVLRVGRRTRADMPLDLDDGDRLNLFASLDITAFDRWEGGNATVRYAAAAGAEWSRTYTSVSDHRSERWNIDGLRHVVEPMVSYETLFGLNRDPDDLFVIDDVERLERRNVLTVGVRDRWQTHQAGQVATLLNTQVTQEIFPDEDRDNDADPVTGDEDDEGRTLGLTRIDTTWQPRANVACLRNATVRWRADYDPTKAEVLESDVRLNTRLDDGRAYQLRHSRLEDRFEFVTLAGQWPIAPNWETAAYTQYDLEENENARSGVLFRQTAHRWFIDYTFELRRGEDSMGGDEDDFRFEVRFSPVAPQDEDLIDQLSVPRRLAR